MKQSRPMTLLMTRPLPSAENFAQKMQDALPELAVIYSPIMKIVPQGQPDLQDAKALVFTSQQAVALFAKSSSRRDLPAYCVGPRTTKAAEEAGLTASQVGHNAKTLVANLSGENPPTPLIHLRGDHSIGQVADRLTESGLKCYEQVLYRQEPLPFSDEAKQALGANNLIILPIFSPRSARLIAAECAGATAPLVIGWISPAVRQAWEGVEPLVHATAQTPDATSLRQALLSAIATADLLEGDSARR